MFISITGELGSGKTTIARLLSENYGFKLYSTGSIQREIAKEKGMSTLELNQYMAKNLDNEYDKLIDNKTIEIAEKNQRMDIVFDSRMAWHFVKESFKVYVIVDKFVAAHRVMGDNRGIEERYGGIHEAIQGLQERKRIEVKRFADMYAIHLDDYSNYDLVVDSSDSIPKNLAMLIYNQAKRRKNGTGVAVFKKDSVESLEERETFSTTESCNFLNDKGEDRHVFLSPKRLYPTKDLDDLALSQEEGVGEEALEDRVDVVSYNGLFYILNGHRNVCGRIQNGVDLMPVHLLNINGDGRIETYDEPISSYIKTSKDVYKKWEEYNLIRFNYYP